MKAVDVKGAKVTFGDPVADAAKAKLTEIDAKKKKANLSDSEKLDIIMLQNDLIVEKLGIK